MRPRRIKESVYWMGAVDWNRRLFDSLIPLPDGTSYNAYLVQGSEKTALLDTVDPSVTDALLSQLENVDSVDYVVAHHAELDHSGAIPQILERYKKARVVTTPIGKEMLVDLLGIPEERFVTVHDGETLPLGKKTLKFVHMPWVHWPETMVTYLQEDGILFTCDFFASHLASTDLYVSDEARVREAAKTLYAEVMMQFRTAIHKNLQKIQGYQISMIAPGHGPMYNRPQMILEAYHDWILSEPRNMALIAYVSTHGSTEKMVEYLIGALAERGIIVDQFNLAVADIGKLAAALVDAATIVFGTPTVAGGPHPAVAYAAYLVNMLKPKLKFASVIGSYLRGGTVVEQLVGMIPRLKIEMLDPVLCKGFPKENDFKALDSLAAAIAEKHKEHNFS